jgi:hypothetical protein
MCTSNPKGTIATIASYGYLGKVRKFNVYVPVHVHVHVCVRVHVHVLVRVSIRVPVRVNLNMFYEYLSLTWQII